MAEWDNAEFLEDVRGRGGLPSGDLRYSDAKLLAAATLELRDVVAPMLVESQTDRAVYLSEVAVTAGQAEYRLPSRALAARFQSVALDDGSGAYQRLRHLSPAAYYQQSSTQQARPHGFYLRDYTLVLVPTPNTAFTLRLPYYQRPAQLVASSAAGVVTAIAGAVVTVGTVPGAFTSGALYDVVRATPGFETLVVGQAATLSGSNLTFPANVPSGVAVGDYVCLAGQAPVPQCPVELRGLLAARTARRALASVGDAQGASLLDSTVEELTAMAMRTLAPRADDEPQEFGDVRRGLLYGVL